MRDGKNPFPLCASRLLLISSYRNCIMFNVPVDIKADRSFVWCSTSYYTHRTYKNDTKQIKWISFPLCYTFSCFFFCCVDRHCISLGTAKNNWKEKIATTKQRIDETIDNGPTQAFLYRNECSSLSFYGRTSRTKNKYLHSGRANEQLGRKEDALRSFF